ncbi:unnamed protein product [Penicillium salamii]|uniref:Vacuolar iron transporter Ccc1 n=1 Tax=Penicillium salamii TaxID=1612424 RepID=A0A9W4JY78_9EURO|nr:unnamed protein product [Penicillium salamii]CAG8193923.1 unnamed protein product [Penicillium salamii]CAG8306849.1 unnamed protein product [Penicillium salamii]CAG8360398.1 unnamed protein product [Penicillium salamii]CAG8405976.1 unnamed protein product [Penicillium salamii]
MTGLPCATFKQLHSNLFHSSVFSFLYIPSIQGMPQGSSSSSRTSSIMSISSVTGLMASYSPLADHHPMEEKDDTATLQSDVETGARQGTGRRSSRLIDGRTVSDAIIGLSDGMTVPFALTAGLSALGDTKVVVYGGLAELIAGAISMGLGGYLGAKSEEESYNATLKETKAQTLTDPASVSDAISDIFEPYELPSELVAQLKHHLSDSPNLPSFLMNFQHTLPEPADSRAVMCALTISLGYFIGGFVPLVPYFFVGPTEAYIALRWSILIMVIALFVFGYGKTCFVSGWKGRQNVRKGLIGGIQMVLVGGVAAGSAMGLVKGFQMLADGSGQN